MERSSKFSLLKIGLLSLGLPHSSLILHQENSDSYKKPVLHQENGFSILLENGKTLRLERLGTRVFDVPPPTDEDNRVLLESNGNALLESGFQIKQESNNNMEDKDLKISELIQAAQLDGRELIPFAKDDANGSLAVSLLKAYITLGLAKQSDVDGKQNKLTAGPGISISPTNEISSTLDVSLVRLVDVLPTSNIEENKIYLIEDTSSTSEENTYLEYMYLNGKWEMMGKYHATVDLTPYLKSADAAQIYAKKSQLPNMELYVPFTTYNLLVEKVALLEQQMTGVKAKLDKYPNIPANDQRCYAIKNGEWEEIADVTEAVATITKDEIEQTAQTQSE